MTNQQIKDLCDEAGSMVGDDGTGDGTGDIRTIVDEELRQGRPVTAAGIAAIVREARQDAADERAAEVL